MASMDASVVIIGTGLAGYSVAREFRKWDKDSKLTLISADDGAYYSKPQLSASLALGKSPDSLVLKSAQNMSSELNATILTHSRVASIFQNKKELILDNGDRVNYQSLVLAVGAITRKAEIIGDADLPVFSVNNLADYHRFHTFLQSKKHVAILGSGLIGCEFANDLAAVRYDVTVIGNGTAPLQGLVPTGMGEALRMALGRLGVHWKLNNGIQSIHRNRSPNMNLAGPVSELERSIRVELTAGDEMATDLILTAIGFIPNLELAKMMGLKINRAILVNENLETSEKDVYALGDCAEILGSWRPYVFPITVAAKALGQTLAGRPVKVHFPLMPVMVKTPNYPMCILPPPPGHVGSWQETIDEAGSECRFINGSRLLGFAVGGNRIQARTALLKEVEAQNP